MKICHITSIHDRFDTRIFDKECKSLANDSHEVHLIVNDLFDDEVKNGIHIHSVKSPFKSKFHRFITSKANKKIYKLALSINADIYHFHDPELLFTGYKLTLKNKKVIYDIHEDVPRQILFKEWIPKLFRPIISFFFEIFENFFSIYYTALVVPVPLLYNRFNNKNSNISIVSNFPYKEDINQANSYSVNNPLIYIGGLTWTRGISQIAKASFNINQHLVLCGSYSSKGLQNLIEKNYVNVTHLGHLSKSQLKEQVSKSSIGLVTLLNSPNDYYAYPIKMFEYMAAGIPIIASNFPIYKSIVEEGNCGICVNPSNVEDISLVITYILNNPQIAKQMGENGKQLIRTKYNWSNEYIKLKNLYIKVSGIKKNNDN
jgi:glycosyltransferase involved in cell wall biosynthesis